MTTAAGPLLFARYAYPPNALGLCGADASRTLLEYGAAGASDAGLAELARTFDGAWPYLTLIAGANRIVDPLDPRVVEAYWVGNELLDHVGGRQLAQHVADRFRGRIGRSADTVAAAAAAGAVPHHCFHVFAVYPWLGLLREGIVDDPLRILEACRITPATVEHVHGDSLDVVARPLVWDGARLRLGDPTRRSVRWRTDGYAFLVEPGPGDHVSLHWDHVCDVLTPGGAERLTRVTLRSLESAQPSLVRAEW